MWLFFFFALCTTNLPQIDTKWCDQRRRMQNNYNHKMINKCANTCTVITKQTQNDPKQHKITTESQKRYRIITENAKWSDETQNNSKVRNDDNRDAQLITIKRPHKYAIKCCITNQGNWNSYCIFESPHLAETALQFIGFINSDEVFILILALAKLYTQRPPLCNTKTFFFLLWKDELHEPHCWGRVGWGGGNNHRTSAETWPKDEWIMTDLNCVF